MEEQTDIGSAVEVQPPNPRILNLTAACRMRFAFSPPTVADPPP